MNSPIMLPHLHHWCLLHYDRMTILCPFYKVINFPINFSFASEDLHGNAIGYYHLLKTRSGEGAPELN